MKMCLLLSIIFSSALCLTPDEKQEITTRLRKENHQHKITEPQFNIISKTLDHAYFGERFTNFKSVLRVSTEGITLNVDFQLLPDHP
jgi:hypothetical protein